MIYALIGLGRCFQSIRNEDSRPFEALLLQPPINTMPKVKKKLFVLILSLIQSATVWSQNSNSLLKDATRHFEVSSFVTAIPKFEQVLQNNPQKLSTSERLSALLQLAYSYKAVGKFENSEQTYRKAFDIPATISGDQLKSYLYFAQVLVQNNKFKEAQEWFEKYNNLSASLRDDARQYQPSTVARISNDPFTQNGRYLVEYLDFNTTRPEFSPMYFKNGLVFCSGKGTGSSLVGNKGFLDLYYISDINKVTGVSEEALNAPKQKAVKTGPSKLGKDFYTRVTANDSKTVNYFESIPAEAVVSKPTTKGQIAESEVFSKTLNTKFHEGPATFSSDFSKIIFTRNNFNEGSQGRSEDNVTKLKLYIAELSESGWSEATELPFNGDDFSTAHPAWSKDGRYLYFSSDRKGGQGGMDIWVVEYKDSKWGTPVNLGKEVNTKGTEVFPFVDERGNVYFASDGLKGAGGLDIFIVSTQNGLPNRSPLNIGEPFNSENDDFGIITDGQRLNGYFSSDRRRGDDDDIYRFTKTPDVYDCRQMLLTIVEGETKTPIAKAEVSLLAKGGSEEKLLTNESGQTQFCVNRDTDYVISVKREGYNTNVLGFSTKGESDNAPSAMDIPLRKQGGPIVTQPEVQPKNTPPVEIVQPTDTTKTEKVSQLKGIVKTEIEKTPIEGVLVTFINECDGSKQQVITGPDGVYAFDMEEGCDYTLEVSKDGYGTTVNKISKVIKKAKPKVVSQDLGLFKEGDLITIDNIYYDMGSAKIRKDAARELDKLAATLMKNPSMIIELGSHTDSRGDAQENLNLSSKRAQAAVDYIASKGVERNRMLAKGYGESLLVNGCSDGVSCTEREHQKNRRTTVKVIKAKTE